MIGNILFICDFRNIIRNTIQEYRIVNLLQYDTNSCPGISNMAAKFQDQFRLYFCFVFLMYYVMWSLSNHLLVIIGDLMLVFKTTCVICSLGKRDSLQIYLKDRHVNVFFHTASFSKQPSKRSMLWFYTMYKFRHQMRWPLFPHGRRLAWN